MSRFPISWAIISPGLSFPIFSSEFCFPSKKWARILLTKVEKLAGTKVQTVNFEIQILLLLVPFQSHCNGLCFKHCLQFLILSHFNHFRNLQNFETFFPPPLNFEMFLSPLLLFFHLFIKSEFPTDHSALRSILNTNIMSSLFNRYLCMSF